MKHWSASNVPPVPSKEPNWKAIVRRLRDWLDSLLEEGCDTGVAEQRVPDPIVPARTTSPLPGEQDRGGVLPDYGGEEEKAKVARWNALRQPPPPEDWLRRVREGAPELLRLVEERQARASGTPGQAITAYNLESEGPPVSAPSTCFTPEPGIRAGNSPCELRPASPQSTPEPGIRPGNPPRERPPVLPASPQFTPERTRSAAETTPSRRSWWFQLLRRGLKVKGLEPGGGKRAVPEKRPIYPTPEQSHVAATANRELPDADDTAPNWHTSQPQITGASEPGLRPKGESGIPKSRWKEAVRRKLQLVRLPRFLPKSPARVLEVEHKNGKPVSPEHAKSPTPFRSTARVESKPEFASSRMPVRSLPQYLLPKSEHRNGPQAVRCDTQVGPSWAGLHPWAPSRDEVSSVRNTPEAVVHFDARQGVPWAFEESPAQAAERWAPLPSLAPEVQGGDPWPALPEEQHRPADSTQRFRNVERLSALDVEQRGGR